MTKTWQAIKESVDGWMRSSDHYARKFGNGDLKVERLEVQSVVAALRKMEKDILTLHRGLVGSGPESKCSWCGAHFTEDGGRHAGSVECSVINEYMDTGGAQ